MASQFDNPVEANRILGLDDSSTLTGFIQEVESNINENVPIDIISSFMKEILEELGKITGETVTEDVIKEIFCLRKGESSMEYNPAGDLSRKIAEKLKERQRILAKQKGEKQGKIAIFSRYISILAVGQQKDINSLMLNSDINLVQVHINEAFHLNIVNFQDI